MMTADERAAAEAEAVDRYGSCPRCGLSPASVHSAGMAVLREWGVPARMEPHPAGPTVECAEGHFWMNGVEVGGVPEDITVDRRPWP